AERPEDPLAMAALLALHRWRGREGQWGVEDRTAGTAAVGGATGHRRNTRATPDRVAIVVSRSITLPSRVTLPTGPSQRTPSPWSRVGPYFRTAVRAVPAELAGEVDGDVSGGG